MKIYVDEMPNSCQKCPFCEYFEEDAHGKGKHEVACYFNGSFGNILYGNQTSPKTCPLESITDHDKKVRAEVVKENQALKARWEKLKEYVNTPKEFQEWREEQSNLFGKKIKSAEKTKV